MRRMKSAGILLAIVVAVGLAPALAACGSSDEGTSATPAPGDTGGTTTYRNDDFRFSLTYPERYEQGDSTSASEAGSDAVFSVGFADPDGTIVAGMSVDGLQVAVYRLNQEVATEQVPQLKAEFQGVVDQMMASLENAAVKDPLDAVELNGVPGFGLSYSYSNDGTDLRASTFFLVKGELEYQVTAQANEDRWDAMAAELEAAAMSFTVD